MEYHLRNIKPPTPEPKERSKMYDPTCKRYDLPTRDPLPPIGPKPQVRLFNSSASLTYQLSMDPHLDSVLPVFTDIIKNQNCVIFVLFFFRDHSEVREMFKNKDINLSNLHSELKHHSHHWNRLAKK